MSECTIQWYIYLSSPSASQLVHFQGSRSQSVSRKTDCAILSISLYDYVVCCLYDYYVVCCFTASAQGNASVLFSLEWLSPNRSWVVAVSCQAVSLPAPIPFLYHLSFCINFRASLCDINKYVDIRCSIPTAWWSCGQKILMLKRSWRNIECPRIILRFMPWVGMIRMRLSLSKLCWYYQGPYITLRKHLRNGVFLIALGFIS